MVTMFMQFRLTGEVMMLLTNLCSVMLSTLIGRSRGIYSTMHLPGFKFDARGRPTHFNVYSLDGKYNARV